MYTLSIAFQTRVFLLALGFGFLLGILYDVFRTVRLLLGGRRFLFFQDVLYLVTITVATFIFNLVVNEGRMRAYSLLGQAIGFLIYYFALGTVAIRVSAAVVNTVKRVFFFTGKVISAPLRLIIRIIHRIYSKLKVIPVYLIKKPVKKLKIHLKKLRVMVYNLHS